MSIFVTTEFDEKIEKLEAEIERLRAENERLRKLAQRGWTLEELCKGITDDNRHPES
jgi:chaperonin cofactor prefoldin